MPRRSSTRTARPSYANRLLKDLLHSLAPMGVLVPSSHSLLLMASLRAHCILAYQLNSRASIAFSCSHCSYAYLLRSYCAHCIFVFPLHSRAPITFSCALCILACPLHPYAPIALSCSIHSRGSTALSCAPFHSRAAIAFTCTHSIIAPLSYPGAPIASLVKQ